MDDTFYLFSTGGLGKLEAGDLVPDFSVLYPDHFSSFQPEVKKNYPARAHDIRLYKGDAFVHAVVEPGYDVEGAVLELTGPAEDLGRWERELDTFERG